MATSVASLWSVRDRSVSPITRLYRPIDVSTLARRLYPLASCHADAAPFGGHPQVTVALCRGAIGRGTHNRACPWRHDDDSVWMTLGNRLADPVLIVIAVGGEKAKRSAIWSRSASTGAPSSTSFLVTSTATISPLSASTPIADDRRPGDPGCLGAVPDLRPNTAVDAPVCVHCPDSTLGGNEH